MVGGFGRLSGGAGLGFGLCPRGVGCCSEKRSLLRVSVVHHFHNFAFGLGGFDGVVCPFALPVPEGN